MKPNLRNLNIKEILSNIDALFFDIDGVLSGSKLEIGVDGELIRTTNVKDGYALKQAINNNITVCIISGGLSESVRKRFIKLGIEDVIIGSKTKLVDFDNLISKHNLELKNVLYMGDDIPDYEIMSKVGLACCPADAVSEIKEISMYISDKKGGDGCARDVIEQVLRAKGNWMKENSFNT